MSSRYSDNEDHSLPAVMIFDLDATIWQPEMYLLRGNPPFAYDKDSNTCSTTKDTVEIIGDFVEILPFLESKGVIVTVASKCDHPAWARELYKKFRVNGRPLEDYIKISEIYYGSKTKHVREILKRLDGRFGTEDVIFWDNECGNIRDVSSMGVHSVHVDEYVGISWEAFTSGVSDWEAKRGGN